MRAGGFGVFLLPLLLCVWTRAEDRPASGPDDKAAAWIEQLGSEDFEVREAAERTLLQMGKPAVEKMKGALRHKDAEVRSRVQHILDTLEPVLALSVEVEGEARVGQAVNFKVRIKNVSDRDHLAVRCLDGSWDGSRFPAFSRLILPDEKPEAHSQDNEGRKRFCGNCNSIGEDDLVKLKPGEAFDPFGEFGHGQGGFGREWLEWKPTQPGKAAVTFSCDYSPGHPLLWNGGVERELGLGGLENRLAQVPKIKLEGKASIDVKP